MGVVIVPVRGRTARSPVQPPYGRRAAARLIRPVASSGTTITYNPESSRKLEQVIGDCDWQEWDATNNLPVAPPTCKRTTSQTITRGDVLGNGLGTSFEHNGELIVMFGDTIGATTGQVDPNTGNRDGPAYYPGWSTFPNTFLWQALDPIARSTTQHAEDGFLLNFFMDGNHALPVTPPAQQDGSPVDMGGDNTPFAGISLDGQIYIACKTGTVIINGSKDDTQDRSVLVKFDETTQQFASGRTISRLASGGHFVHTGLYEAPPGILGIPAPVQPEPVVVIFGLGEYRNSNIYLSIIPKSEFETGLDASGMGATRYFEGFAPGSLQPMWSNNESDSFPVVNDVDPVNPTIGNFSVFYSEQLGLWLMTFDGGRNSSMTRGTYFTYATQPWGPWSPPQLIFNDCNDHGFGNFIYYYYKTDKENDCKTAMPPGDNPAPNHSGPAGPTIGDQTTNDPHTNRGASFAPQMIQRFTEIEGNTLKIFYNLSSGNPYGVVLMESDFTIVQPSDFSLAFAESTVTTGSGKVPVTLNINRMGGFTGAVTISDKAATPKGIIPLLTAASTTGNSVTFKIKVKGSVQPGTYELVFTGTDGSGRERNAELLLVVH